MEPYVRLNNLHEGIVEIEFFHPAHNSMPGFLLKELAEAINNCGQNAEVSLIILKSGGDRTFCAGASFEELIGIEDLDTGKNFFMGFAHVINACRTCPKLILGRVQGKAVGGGVGLAAAVDYCYATKFAAIKLSELNVGIGPFVVSPAIERKIGVSNFSQLAIHAQEFYEAEWAKAKGLYAQVFENAELMDEAILKHAQFLVSTNPEARRLLKEVMWQGCENWDELLAERAAMSGTLVLSAFTKKALAKFKK